MSNKFIFILFLFLVLHLESFSFVAVVFDLMYYLQAVFIQQLPLKASSPTF
jgi:hypothetical protein